MEVYLDKCLSSLIVKDINLLNSLEVFVIIDGATDRSSEIAHTYQLQYPDVFCVIDKTNGNYGSCVNKGLEIATGSYVKVLDADDSFDTFHFEAYLRYLNNVDVDMVITPYVVVDEMGRENRKEIYDLPVNEILSWKQLTPAFKKKPLQMHAVTYKLQNIRDINYHQTEGISYTDQEWIFTPLTTVNTAIAYPDVIYNYLIGRAGQTINPEIYKRSISQNEKCCRRIICDYKSFGRFDTYKQEYIDYKFLITLTAMYQWYLIRYTDLDIMQLEDFDDFVKSVDESYLDLLDAQRLQYTCFRYIKYWHRTKRRHVMLSTLYCRYERIMDRVCRIYAK